MSKVRIKWTDELVISEVKTISDSLGYFPSAMDLRKMGKNSLTCAITRRGGFEKTAADIGAKRNLSDSDLGWNGESEWKKMCEDRGLACEKMNGVKAPFDLMVSSVLKVDVKTTNYAEYGACRGWFYHINKISPCDLLLLYQYDTKNFFGLPWWECPTTGVTISRDGGKYANHLNNWETIEKMINFRKSERDAVSESSLVNSE